MKHQYSNSILTKHICQVFFLLLFLIGFQTQGETAIGYPEKDSTIQEIIEFTHFKKKNKTGFFKKDDKVVIYTSDKSTSHKGTITGFTKDGVLLDGKEIPIAEINLIRGQSILASIFSVFSGITLIGGLSLIALLILGIGLLSVLLSNAATLFGLVLIFIVGVTILFGVAAILVSLLSLALIFALSAGISTRSKKFYSLKKKWAAKITSKKLPVEKIK